MKRTPSYTFEASGLSDVGQVRENNEDVWAEIEELSFFALADGMGGHKAGEVASREAVSHLLTYIREALSTPRKKSLGETATVVREAILRANQEVYKISRTHDQLRGMGTTLCTLLLHEEGAILIHVGDSRIYRLRGGVLEPMTRDHSLFAELVELGQLSENLAPEFAYKNIITKAIGTEPNVDPTVVTSDIRENDRYLLCTDGLTDMLSLKEIEQILKKYESVDEAVKMLIEVANNKGGHDNITVILVQIHEKQPQKKPLL